MARHSTGWTIGAALAAVFAVGFASLWSHGSYPTITPYALALALGSAVTSALLWRDRALSGWVVLVIAAVLHGVALAGATAFEDDFYRFIWDGWRTLSAGTPYGVAPSEFFTDPEVPEALLPVLDGVNYPEIPTIYGPALQGFLAAVYYFAETNPIGLRLAFAACNLVLVAIMLGRFAPSRVALYAWNPLAIAEIALHAHPDAIMAALLFAALALLYARPAIAGVLFALAAGVKIVALVAWPLMLRTRPAALLAALATMAAMYGWFLVQDNGAGFETTTVFARYWDFNPFAYEAAVRLFAPDTARLICAALAAVAIVWLHSQSEGDRFQTLAMQFGILLFFASAVNAWYLLWILPFAISGRQIWPFAAAAALPLSYFTGLNLEIEAMDPFVIIWPARIAEIAIIAGAIGWDVWQARKRRESNGPPALKSSITAPRVTAIIPALNEEGSVAQVVTGLRSAGIEGLDQIIVVDNGSTDQTAAEATRAGAIVISEPDRGYGAACLAGIGQLPADTNIVLFADADAADDPADAVTIVRRVARGHDLVIGSRTTGQLEPGSMTWPQRFGNVLAPWLIRLFWGYRFTDLGPLRAIRRSSLEALEMADRDFGWTVEMQVAAARQGLTCDEVPVCYRKRIGTSKISGTVKGVVLAGTKIIYVVLREAFGNFTPGTEPDRSHYQAERARIAARSADQPRAR